MSSNANAPPPPPASPPPIISSINHQHQQTVKPSLIESTAYGRKVDISSITERNKTDELISIVCISDTHNNHDKLMNKIPEKGHILIHCGDSTGKGTEEELDNFNQFLGQMRQRFEYIVVIAGNHDYGLDPRFSQKTARDVLNNATHYLQDSLIELYGITIYGSPWTKSNMAFGAKPQELETKWQKIPDNVDILITHSPPFSILDLAFDKRQTSSDPCSVCDRRHKTFAHWGEKNLQSHVLNRIKPKIHLFGHVHDDEGACIQDGTLFINCASALRLMRQPMYIEYPITTPDRSSPKQKPNACAIH